MSNPNDPAYPTSDLVDQNYVDANGDMRCRTVALNRGGLTIRQEFVDSMIQLQQILREKLERAEKERGK